MVLNSSSGLSDDSTNDTAPASDSDPYASSKTTRQDYRYHINFAQLPKPIPVLGPLFGFNETTVGKLLGSRIQTASAAMRRPVTEDEAQALAYWTARQQSITSYGPPLGMMVGMWRAYNTSRTFQFPFYKPNLQNFNPQVFPPNLKIINGQRAIFLWHAMRWLSYGVIGNYVGRFLFGGYAVSVAAVGEISDPRLKAFVDSIRSSAQQKQGQLPHPTRQPVQTGTVYGQKDRDASPTGGTYGNVYGEGSDGEGQMSDKIGGLGEPRQKTSSVKTEVYRNSSTRFGDSSGEDPPKPVEDDDGRPWAEANRASKPTTVQSYQEPQTRPFDLFDDDSSPTGGQGVIADTTPVQSGSAWERIRRGANTSPAPTTGSSWPTGRPSQPPGRSAWAKIHEDAQQEQRAGEDYAFSKSEEERSFAKSEAQKEFDARVERERQGGDFGSSGDDQRRW